VAQCRVCWKSELVRVRRSEKYTHARTYAQFPRGTFISAVCFRPSNVLSPVNRVFFCHTHTHTRARKSQTACLYNIIRRSPVRDHGRDCGSGQGPFNRVYFNTSGRGGTKPVHVPSVVSPLFWLLIACIYRLSRNSVYAAISMLTM
jgi:hypothetical protein